MKKIQTKILYRDLPRSFVGLCNVLTPRPIRDRTDYEKISEVVDAMALWNKEFSADQEDYFDPSSTVFGF